MISSLILKILNIYKFFDRSFSIKNKNQKEANKIQLELLKYLVSKSKNTRFGIDHNFRNINNYLEYKNLRRKLHAMAPIPSYMSMVR